MIQARPIKDNYYGHYLLTQLLSSIRARCLLILGMTSRRSMSSYFSWNYKSIFSRTIIRITVSSITSCTFGFCIHFCLKVWTFKKNLTELTNEIWFQDMFPFSNSATSQVGAKLQADSNVIFVSFNKVALKLLSDNPHTIYLLKLFLKILDVDRRCIPGTSLLNFI